MAIVSDVFMIDGMGCEHCVKAVTDAALSVPGVEGCVVDLEKGSATIRYEKNDESEKEIASAIEEAGYTVISTR